MAENNASILDAIRLSGTADYQQRVPSTTQTSVKETQDAIMNGGLSIYNAFVKGLMNKVGTTLVRDWEWYNPLAVFKQQGIISEYGYALEELAMDLITAQGYDIRAEGLFKQNPGKVYAEFHTENRTDQYLISVHRHEIAKAFTSEEGLNSFLSMKLAKPGLSDQYDEMNIMINLIADAWANDELHKVQIDVVDTESMTKEELNKLSIKIRTYAKRMAAAPNGLYNAKGVATVSNIQDLVFITTPEVMAALDVTVLADAFNQDRADFASRVIEIPEFPMDGVYGMLVDKSWFICGDTLNEVTFFENPETLVSNHWLHRHGIYSTSKFSNAVIFGDAAGTNTDIVTVTLDSIGVNFVDEDENDVVADTYAYGDNLKVVTEASGTITPANANVKVPNAATFSISLADAEGEVIALNRRSYLDRNGRLYVQRGLIPGSVITVTATSTYVNPSGDGKPGAPVTAETTLTVA